MGGELGELGSPLALSIREDLLVACFKAGFAKAWNAPSA